MLAAMPRRRRFTHITNHATQHSTAECLVYMYYVVVL